MKRTLRGKPIPRSKPALKKTLERVLSKAGLGSRTDARSWIHARRVTVNGRITENPDQWVDLLHDQVAIDGNLLEQKTKRYILLHKPVGYVTTYRDPENRPTVYDLITEVGCWLAPVGRLDMNTSGLLILTNDTGLADRLTNPDFHVPKRYQVKASTFLSDSQLEKLRAGVLLNDGPTRPAVVTRLPDSGTSTHLEITITEGRNRQVRRMLEAVDSKVAELARTAIGRLRLGSLQPGEWREVSEDEI